MGDSIEAKEYGSLAVSGNVHANNVHIRADERLAPEHGALLDEDRLQLAAACTGGHDCVST